ncbi:MFS transporter [Allosphingosinicella indica]|uniref:Metabolite-proton symporter n=1 Tax=Allosphingosinicella indica TaxID=941907 RepID=A0A1X7GQX9_9SPHN|nr:MFS transporter [Allosphingosinicella indica]SMF73425.1 metabolite-proton symporter [Allosphingosinicella indica]
MATKTGERTPITRVVGASLIGTTIEWYDFFLYGSAAALVFNRLFFPDYDPLTGTLLAFATYALGFVARPVGGIVFGHYGDRIGRKRLLMLSLVLMGVATVLIGLLPTYAQIGIWAPLALILLRLVQGFAVGGEWGGAVLMAAEHGDAARRGFWASWPQAGVAAGNLLAAGILALMAAIQDEADFLAWGWRIPFLLSAALVVVGWYIRNRVSESATFEDALAEAEAPPKLPAMDVIRERPRAVLFGAGIRWGENISYYILTVFSLTFLVDVAAESRSLALNALLIGAAVQFFAIPAFAALSDRIGRKPVYAFGGLGLAAWSFAFFPLLASGNDGYVILAIVVGLVLHGAMYGPQAAFIAELFPTRIRYSGVSIAYQLTSILAGSLAPIIALWLYRETGSALPVAIYVGVSCAISGITALLARETKGIELAAIR